MTIIIKNKHAPNNDPKILFKIFVLKNLEPSPIKITLPQVKNVTPWRPITKSVIMKLKSRAGKYLVPSKVGI